MTPQDKQHLKDTYNQAVNKSPYKDDFVEGIADHEGNPVTTKQFVELMLASDEFYDVVESVMKQNNMTLGQFIERNISEPFRIQRA